MKEIISEQEFLKLVNNEAVSVLRVSLFLEEDPNPQFLNKKLFYVISAACRDLEDFLDGHGAKNNKTWLYFRELVASSRSFGFIAFLIEHIENSHIGPQDQDFFFHYLKRTRDIKEYLREALIRLFNLIREEAERLKISFPPKGLSEKYYFDIPYDKMLPQNLDGGETKNEREHLIKIASIYLNIIKEFEELGCTRTYDDEEVENMIPQIINEEKIRRFELSIHNIESVFDTYVKGTALETEDDRLPRLRTQLYITLHLLECGRALSHFFERHEQINDLIEETVTRATVPGCAINWALYSANLIMQRTKQLVNELLIDYTATEAIELPVPRELGFHLRPSTLVAKVVNHYGSDVVMKVGNDSFDATSVLNITWAGGKIAREKIDTVTFVGDKRTLQDLKILAGVNYGEDSMGKDRPLPKELSYLR